MEMLPFIVLSVSFSAMAISMRKTLVDISGLLDLLDALDEAQQQEPFAVLC